MKSNILSHNSRRRCLKRPRRERKDWRRSYNLSLFSTVPTPPPRGTLVGPLGSLPAALAALVCGGGCRSGGRGGRCRRRGISRSRRGGTRIGVRVGVGVLVVIVVVITSLSDGEILAIILSATLSNWHLQRRVIRIRNHRTHAVKPSW